MGKKNSNIKINIPEKKEFRSGYKVQPTQPALYNLHPYFSFRYFHKNHKKFSFKAFKNKKDFQWFLNGLCDLSQITWKEILIEKRDYYHSHEVHWSKTDFKDGFTHLSDKFNNYPVIQFKVFKECRVFGFFNKDNVFKIVWIDRGHIVIKEK